MALPAPEDESAELVGPILDAELVEPDEPSPSTTPAARPRLRLPSVRVRPDQLSRSQRLALMAGRFVLNNVVLVLNGLMSWLGRAHDGLTYGKYRQAIASARAAGDAEALADWVTRHQMAKRERFNRLLQLPVIVFGLAKMTGLGLLVLAVSVPVVGVLVQVTDSGSFLGVMRGSRDALRWVFWFVPAAVEVLVQVAMVAPVLLLLAAWFEGRRRLLGTRWRTVRPSKAAEVGAVVTADGIVRALQHLGLPETNKAFRDGWIPTFHTTPIKDGNGYRAVVELPYGMAFNKIVDKADVLARNLHRNRVEVWPTDHGLTKGGIPGYLDLWVANRGALDAKTPPYPYLYEGTTDIFKGVPFGVSLRGDPIVVVLFEANFVCGGQPGQGKSNACRVIVLGAALDPLCRIWVFVFASNSDFDAFEPRLEHYQKGTANEQIEQALRRLYDLYAEIERREARLSELPASKLTRKIAKEHPDMRPIVAVFSECHELFSHKDYGKEAGEVAAQIVRRGRKVGIICGFDTQSSRTGAIPRALVENIAIAVCFRVKTHEVNDGFLGAGSYKAGIRATELRFNDDRGTSLATGISESAFEMLKWHFVARDDDAGTDEASEVIARAVGAAAAAGTPMAGGSQASVAPARDLLADVLAVSPAPTHRGIPTVAGSSEQ
jgi:S-DNA-T family DNA segregation ATPase FtsK/SpoIIIE